jgi:hypothetical protein
MGPNFLSSNGSSDIEGGVFQRPELINEWIWMQENGIAVLVYSVGKAVFLRWSVQLKSNQWAAFETYGTSQIGTTCHPFSSFTGVLAVKLIID